MQSVVYSDYSSFKFLVFGALLALAACVLRWFFHPVFVARSRCRQIPHPSEQFFPNRRAAQSSNTKQAVSQSEDKFPSLRDDPSLSLSIVVPAYNEEDRIRVMMDEMMLFLTTRAKKDRSFSFEVIVVDDGSADSTAKIVLEEYVEKYSSGRIRLLKLHNNLGKGGAVREGAVRSRGELVLMADADGATEFSEVTKLERALVDCRTGEKGRISVGSRAHLQDEAIVQRSFLRNLLMHGFHFLVSFICGIQVRDTQCGFKLFDREAARTIFFNLHVERWAFDVEALFLAHYTNMVVKEIPVNWTEIPGSKLNVIGATLSMLREILLIRLCYTFRIWNLKGEERLGNKKDD